MMDGLDAALAIRRELVQAGSGLSEYVDAHEHVVTGSHVYRAGNKRSRGIPSRCRWPQYMRPLSQPPRAMAFDVPRPNRGRRNP